jgi:cholesterol oxidase
VPPPPLGLECTEELKGFCTRAVRDAAQPEDYRSAADLAQQENSFLDFKLTILIEDVREFIESKEHQARAEGYVDSSVFGRKRRVEEGTFNLFIEGGRKPTKRIVYRLKFFGDDGARYLLDGYKVIRDDPGLDLWADNTTLYTTVRVGWGDDDRVAGQGIMYVSVVGFLEQLSTYRVRNSPSAGTSARCLGRFGRFYFGELWESYIRQQIPGAPSE